MVTTNNARGPAAVADALMRAKMALDQDRAGDAEQLARTVLAKDARNAAALQILGGALLLQQRHAEAIAPLEGAARVLRDPALDTQLAIALREAGRTDEALSRLKRAIKREPPYVFAFHELGFLLYSLQRYDEAIAAIQRGIEIAPLSSNCSCCSAASARRGATCRAPGSPMPARCRSRRTSPVRTTAWGRC